MNELFTAAIFGSYNGKLITVEFTDRDPATYPAAVLEDMTKERNVSYIIDAETGEVLFPN